MPKASSGGITTRQKKALEEDFPSLKGDGYIIRRIGNDGKSILVWTHHIVYTAVTQWPAGYMAFWLCCADGFDVFETSSFGKHRDRLFDVGGSVLNMIVQL